MHFPDTFTFLTCCLATGSFLSHAAAKPTATDYRNQRIHRPKLWENNEDVTSSRDADLRLSSPYGHSPLDQTRSQQYLGRSQGSGQTPSWRGRILAPFRLLTGLGSSEAVSSEASRALSSQALAQYGDQLVLRFSLTVEDEVTRLADAVDILSLDVWAYGQGWMDVRMEQRMLPSLLSLLPESMQHSHRAIMNGRDLAVAVAATLPTRPAIQTISLFSNGRTASSLRLSNPMHYSTNADIFFEDFQPLDVISQWMRLLQSLFSSHVELITVGYSDAGREIKGIRAGVRPADEQQSQKPRKTIIMSAGQHAREWISVSTVNYVAYSIIAAYGKDAKITKLLDMLDLIFVPTLNPDGYAYSFENDRLWRKNRQPTSLSFCPGVDLDRCWGFKWDGQRTADNPCSESFAGSHPFGSSEVDSFSKWIRNQTESRIFEVVGFLDLHSYSQQILYPFSFSCDDIPPTLEDLEEMGQGLAKAIRGSSHASYEVLPACEGNVALRGQIAPQMSSGGGSALDWFYHELGVRKAFQIKLRDQGVYGFLLPKEFIVPTGAEILSAVEWFAEQMVATLTTDNTMSEGQFIAPVDV